MLLPLAVGLPSSKNSVTIGCASCQLWIHFPFSRFNSALNFFIWTFSSRTLACATAKVTPVFFFSNGVFFFLSSNTAGFTKENRHPHHHPPIHCHLLHHQIRHLHLSQTILLPLVLVLPPEIDLTPLVFVYQHLLRYFPWLLDFVLLVVSLLLYLSWGQPSFFSLPSSILTLLF